MTGKEYATKDMANIVGIAPQTVRKYAQALEKAGYKFVKNENGSRIFIDKDILVLNEVKDISNSQGVKVERIAEMIVNKQGSQGEAEAATVEVIDAESDIVQKLDDIVTELQAVKESNRAMREYIKESLERRDRELMKAMRKSLEESKVRALQEAAAAKENRLWRRIRSIFGN